MIEHMKWYWRHGSKKTKFTWREMHHMYTGFGLMFLGFIGIFELWPMWVVWCLLGFGAWNIVDDVLQHINQRVQYELLGYYTLRSLLHWIWYPKLYKNKI